MVEIVQAFTSRYPACEVAFVDTGLSENPLSWLRDGRIDLLATRLPIIQPDIAVGPVLSRERRVLLVSRDDPLADREEVAYEDIGDRPVSDVSSFPRELIDAFIPPTTPSGRRLRRIDNHTIEECMVRVAMGVQVHPATEGWLDHHAHPGVVSLPISDLPPSDTALVWVAAVRRPRISAFIAAARDVLADTELADGWMRPEVGPAYGRLREAFEDTNEPATGITGTVRLGIYRNALNAGPHMTDIVRTFTQEHPASTVEFVDVGSMADSLGSLRSGHVDMITARLPLSEPDITVGPVLARQRRVLLVARDDELSSRDAINYDDIGDRPVGTLRPSMPTELRDAFIPPTSAAGRVLARAPGTLGTPTEINMQVALGALVHVTVEGWTERHHHPDVVAVPIRDLPPSETALAWLTNLTSPRTSAFVSTARDVLANTELAGNA